MRKAATTRAARTRRTTVRRRVPAVNRAAEVSPNVALTRALERAQPFLQSGHDAVFVGPDGAGKRFHAQLLHTKTRGSDCLVELLAHTGEDVLRAQLFGDDKKRLQGKYAIVLPELTPRTTLFVKGIELLSILQQTLISRFLIEREQRADRIPGRVIISTALSWPVLLRKLPDSLAHSLHQFDLCTIPPLRERIDELPSLVESFLARMSGKGREPWHVAATTYELLKTRAWRDNVRELKYVIQSAAADSPGDQLHLPTFTGDEIQLMTGIFDEIQAGKRIPIEKSIAALEKGILERALIKCNFDQRKTARMLSLTEPNLTYRIKKFGIYIPSDR
jgi:DNA-binding NtrC family response regulator